MPQTTLTVNGRDYEIACGPGEEAHLAKLADVINGHINNLSQQVGQVGEARMLLMTALILADKVDEYEEEGVSLAASAELEQAENQVAGMVDRIEKIAAQLKHA